jgi:hypothetical protein
MSGFTGINLIDSIFQAPQKKKSDSDDYDPFQDSDDEDAPKAVASTNPLDTAFTGLFQSSAAFPDIMNSWFSDPKAEEAKRLQEQQQQLQREFEEEERKRIAELVAKRRKEERDKYEEEQRRAEAAQIAAKSPAKSTSFFSKRSPTTPEPSKSAAAAPPPLTKSDSYSSTSPAPVEKEVVMQAVAYQPDEETLRRREEQQRLYYEKELAQQQLRWEADQKRQKEIYDRRQREELEHQSRLEHEAHQQELQEYEKLRQEQDSLEKKLKNEALKKQEEAELKRLKDEQEKERKIRELQTRKISRLVQKQIDRQELSRQYSNAAKPTISRELIQKITEVQVNEDLDLSYQKRKEEEYKKLKEEKIREVENSEFQKNLPVLGWIVGGIMGNAPPATATTTTEPSKYDPFDEKRSPFEKHLTDVGFRVSLHKFKTYDDYYSQYEKKDDDDRRIETTLTRKAILRYDPSFNSLYLDVKVEGHSTIFHFNIVRDIKHVTRGVRATSILRVETELPEKTKYISINLTNKMADVILEFESAKAANMVYPELSSFITFRKDYPTMDVGAQLFPAPKHALDSSVLQPTLLPASQLNSIFEIENVITPKLVNATPKSPPVRTAILKSDAVKGLGSAIANPTSLFKGREDDDDNDEGTKSSKK